MVSPNNIPLGSNTGLVQPPAVNFNYCIQFKNTNDNENGEEGSGISNSQLQLKLQDHIKTKAGNTTLGHVKIDNDTIKIDENGVISVDKNLNSSGSGFPIGTVFTNMSNNPPPGAFPLTRSNNFKLF